MAKAKKKAAKKPANKLIKKAVKKVVKKPVKKVVKKAVKPAVKKVAKSAAPRTPVKRTVVETIIKTFQIPNKKVFAMEITLLDKLQSELYDAIAARPGTMDYEEMRLFVDNVYMTLNKTATIAKDVKNMILNKEFKESITDTYNSPA